MALLHRALSRYQTAGHIRDWPDRKWAPVDRQVMQRMALDVVSIIDGSIVCPSRDTEVQPSESAVKQD